jgi:uncharacterized protein
MQDVFDILGAYQLTPFQWALAIFSAILIGIGKAGLNAISIITVTTLAWVFGSKISTGIVLPMLIVGDILAVLYYKRHVHWQSLWKLSIWIILGTLLATWVGKDLNEAVFKKIMAGLVFIVVGSMIWLETRPLHHVSNSSWFSASMGIATGFTSMIGNQAGGFANVYLLSMRLEKNHFIGTNAWLFLFINIFKLPFHIFSWHTVQARSLAVNLVLLPALILGFSLGIFIVKNIKEYYYRKIIIWLTALAAIVVFFI